MDQMDPASELAQNITRQVVPGMTWAEKLDPMQLIQMLQGLIGGGAGQGQPQPQPQQGMGGGSLRDRMLLEQRARQLSEPGGMGY